MVIFVTCLGTFWWFFTAAAAKSLQSCPTLCDPTEDSPRGSPVPGILEARTLEWVAIAFSNVWKWKVKVKSLSLVRLSDSMDWGLPGSSVHGIFQARVLEWGAIETAYTLSKVSFRVFVLLPLDCHCFYLPCCRHPVLCMPSPRTLLPARFGHFCFNSTTSS